MNEVGSQRGTELTALFQPPLPEPDVRLSTHPALRGGNSTGIGLMRPPPHPLGCVRLPLFPFPMYRTLLRSFEYYENSATMRLSLVRWSHRLTPPLVRP